MSNGLVRDQHRFQPADSERGADLTSERRWQLWQYAQHEWIYWDRTDPSPESIFLGVIEWISDPDI